MIVNQDNSLNLLDKYFETAFSAPDGIQRLRELILTLAMQGKLVPQDPSDQPASELLKEIKAEKKRLIKEKKIKKSKSLPEIIPDEIPYKIPNSWEWVRLGNIGETQTGTTPPRKDLENFGDFIPFINPGDMKNYSINYSENGLSEIGLSKGRLIEKNSILMVCIGGSIGKHAINDRDLTCNQQINTITPYIRESVRFVFFAMGEKTFQEKVINQAGGSATPIINKQKWSSIFLPLPPLNEQRRIVEKIDRLMAQCDRLEKLRTEKEQKRLIINIAGCDRLLKSENEKEFNQAWDFINNNFGELYAVKENVRELRKAILQLAVMGKLVPQDPSDRPASELLKEIEAEKKRLIKEGKIKESNPLPEITPDEIPYEIPESWEWVKFEHICSYIQRGKSPKYIDKSDFPVIAQKCIQWHGLELEKAKFICPESIKKYSEIRFLQTGDLLWNSTGLGTLGRVGIYIHEDNIYETVVADSHVTIIRPIFVQYQFMYFWIASHFVQGEIESKSSGSTKQIELATSTVKNYLCPLPPLNEQCRIVEKIDRLMAQCDKLEEKIEQSTDKKTTLLNAVMANI